MASKSSKETPTFEQSIARLEEIVQLTDAPVTELESMISLVEEGTKITRHCRSILKKAELRIEALENPESPTTTLDAPQEQTPDEPDTFSLS